MKHRALLLVILGVLLGLAGWALYQRYELVTETVDLGYGPLARRDPMLAARRYLQQSGHAVTTTDSLERIGVLPADGTLIVDNATSVPGNRQAERLLEWVGRGGHLIVVAAEEDGDRPMPLLAPFGVARQRAETAKGDTPGSAFQELLRELERASGARQTEVQAPPAQEMSELEFDGVAEKARVRFDRRFILAGLEDGEDEDEDRNDDNSAPRRVYAAGSEAGVHFAQFEWGEGLVTVMSDMDIWHNADIGDHDHAFLLGILTGEGGAVHILQGAEMPALTDLLWRNAREALLATALWIAAWIAWRSRRFGPLREPESDNRRALGEHILAGSRFRWRNDGGAALLGNARSALLERAERRVPDLPAGTAELRDALERHTAVPAAAIEQALNLDPRRDPEALRRAATHLQSLWNKL